jgi:hypothetical protein
VIKKEDGQKSLHYGLLFLGHFVSTFLSIILPILLLINIVSLSKEKEKEKALRDLTTPIFFLFPKELMLESTQINPYHPALFIYIFSAKTIPIPIKKRELPPNFGPSQFLLVCLSLHSPLSIRALAGFIKSSSM